MVEVAKALKRFCDNIYVIFLVFLLLVIFSQSANAVTYYIDFDNGNDSASGTSSTTAWKTIPGTRTTNNSTWRSTSWGGQTIDANHKVPAGTIFKLKSGSVHDASDGGQILISSTFYHSNYTLENPVLFQRDTTPNWGNGGAVIFDGAGFYMTAAQAAYAGFGVIHMQVGGVCFDGVTSNGIEVRNGPNSGISSYANGGGQIVGTNLSYIKFFNNGTTIANDTEGASQGQLLIHYADGGTIRHCNFDGNNRYGCGIMAGETTTPTITNLTIDHCVVYNHKGDDDAGIGIKTVSAQATISNCEMYNNFKGSDNGAKKTGFNPVLKFINNYVHHNVESGLNGNGAAAINLSNVMNMYLINNIIVDNGVQGSYFYDGAMNLYLFGNLFANNGTIGSSYYGRANLKVSNNVSPPEGAPISIYLYNNIFYKPDPGANSSNIDVPLWRRFTAPISGLSISSDYNAWVQNSSEYFSNWGSLSGSDETVNFSYGVDGPGHTTGKWYNWYGGSAMPPASGALGHFHQDVHSKGTGAADSTLPKFKDYSARNFELTEPYSGVNLLTKFGQSSWYISEINFDRSGKLRSTWDIGPYDYKTPVPVSPKNLSVLKASP
jgi:hypothetical protein